MRGINKGLEYVSGKYIIRQVDMADRVFASCREAIEYLVSHPGYAKLFIDDELVMLKGIPPHASDHDSRVFRGVFAAAADA